MTILTVEDLHKGRERPCAGQVALFSATWPAGMEVNIQNYMQAWKLGLSVDWVVDQCLPETLRELFYAEIAPIRARYDAGIASIRARNDAERASDDAERDLIRARYDAGIASIWLKYVEMWLSQPLEKV